MLVRLWWKDARQFWPIWMFLACFALMVQWALIQVMGREVKTGLLGDLALGWATLYACAVGAAAIAGERENKTLAFLDGQGLARQSLWSGKASFAFASTLVLAVFLFGLAMLGTDRWEMHGGLRLGLFLILCTAILLEAVGWGLLWSSLTSNPMLAAVLTIFSLLVSLAIASPTPVFAMRSEMNENLVMSVAIIKLAIACATTAASYFIVVGGQPGRTGRRSASRIEPATFTLAPVIKAPRRVSFWSPAFRALIWQTWREAWPICWRLMLVYPAVAAIVAVFDSPKDIPGFVFIMIWPIGLIAGIFVFGSSHSGRTYRFLTHHGARPGTVWLVKVGVWSLWLGLMGLVGASVISLRLMWDEQTHEKLVVMGSAGFGALALTAAVGTLCGMVIRAGITAGVVAAAVAVAIYMPLSLLYSLHMFPVWGFAAIPLACLFVSWLWSADWMYDRPGAGRWVRLSAYVLCISCVLFVSYVGFRVYGIPAVDPAALDQFRPRGAMFANRQLWPLYSNAFDTWSKGDKATSLTLLREAAALPFDGDQPPYERYLEKRLNGPRPLLPNGLKLIEALADSAEKQLNAKELDGAWDDIFALARTARHLGRNQPALAYRIDERALSLTLQWAADPKQTPERLKIALAALLSLPPLPSAAERFANEADLVDLQLQVSRERLLAGILGQSLETNRNPDPWSAFIATLQTTRWEIARARRAARLMFTSYAERAALPAWQRSESTAHVWIQSPFTDITETTPILSQFLVNFDQIVNPIDFDEAARAG